MPNVTCAYVLRMLERLWIGRSAHLALVPGLMMLVLVQFCILVEGRHSFEVGKLGVIMSKFCGRWIWLKGREHFREALCVSSNSIIVIFSERQFLPSGMICWHSLNIDKILLTANTIDGSEVLLGQHAILFSLLLLIEDFSNFP